MSEYLARHATDFGKHTDMAIFDHCLPSEAPVVYDQMQADEMQERLHEVIGLPVQLPELQFNDLSWNVVRWPLNEVALMYGTDPTDTRKPEIAHALGTVVAWHDGLHVAGIQQAPDSPGRVIAGKYTPQTDFDNNTTYHLFRGDIVVSQSELALDNEALAKAAKKHYTYLAYGDNIVERPFITPAPSHFDGQTERPFDTAGLITQAMIDQSWNNANIDPADRPVTFTFFHHNTYIPGFLRMLSRRNRILAATPHIAPLEGDAHRIVVNGIAYELPTSLPVAQ